MEEHHKHPRAYGGTDDPDNRVWLCASDHSLLHRSALRLYSGKGGEAKDMVVRFLPNQPARQERLLRLVQTVARARQQHARSSDVPEAGVEADDHQSTVKMQLDVPDWLHHRLKALSTGRGLYRYVMHVLENHCLVATQKPGAPQAELYGAGRAAEQRPRDPQPTPLTLLDPRR